MIADGRWSDPAASYAKGRGVPPTHPEGQWGVYAADFTDTYTLGQIEPLEAQYENLRNSMQSARDSLYVSERFVNTLGLFDRIPEVQEQLQSWIDECNARIHTVQATLEVSRGQVVVMEQGSGGGGAWHSNADMGALLLRLEVLK